MLFSLSYYSKLHPTVMAAWKPMKCFDIQIKRRLEEIYNLSVTTSSWFGNYFLLSSFTIVMGWLLADGDDCDDVLGRLSAWSFTPTNIIIYSQWGGIKQTNFSLIFSKLLRLCYVQILPKLMTTVLTVKQKSSSLVDIFQNIG